MPDIIQLLSDNIANQIAAGEVIQRPASAVKEMLENAIDAGATSIHLMIKDAGKELIQVNDNGKGMSPTDARLCFERHATSKIKSIDDLFSIRTMGFRGEALASIAAVAKVELKTRTQEDEVGTCILIENSTVTSQEPCQANVGSSLAVKNLFFNVPARRNFLKTTTTETRHVIDEFIRVAMAFPEIAFRFTNNNTDIFNLEAGKLKLRILGLLGNNLNNKLVPVEEDTDFVTINGFIASPEMANKTRGNQFFFVNNRFIKSAYLNHAVAQAYRDLIAKDEFPLFVLFIDIDPKRVDINVHPTKQEIKFEEDKVIYSIVNAAVRHALSKYSIAPSLDFSLDTSIEMLPSVTQPFAKAKQEETKNDYLFQSFREKGKAHFLEKKEDARNWKELYKVQQEFQHPYHNEQTNNNPEGQAENELPLTEEFKTAFIQLNHAFIIATTKTGCLLIDQHLAHQRILFEKFQKTDVQTIPIQQCLHPQPFEMAPSDAVLLNDMLEDLYELGFDITWMGNNTFAIQGIPADLKQGNEVASIEKIMEDYKHFSSEISLDKREKLWRTLAKQQAIAYGKKLSEADMQELFDKLLLCEQPQLSPIGKKLFVKLSANDLSSLINNG